MQTQAMFKEAQQKVTEADILFALVPLIREYFEGSCSCDGKQIVYTLPDGRKMRITAEAIA